jgi:hypothetical protein
MIKVKYYFYPSRAADPQTFDYAGNYSVDTKVGSQDTSAASHKNKAKALI